MKKEYSRKEVISNKLYYIVRIGTLLSIVMMFFPGINPSKICDYVSKNMSLFTSGIDYGSLVRECTRAFNQGWIQQSTFIVLYIASMVTCIGIALVAVCGCMSMGNLKMKQLGNRFSIIGSIVQIIGLIGIYVSYILVSQTNRPEKVIPQFQTAGFLLFAMIAFIILITTIAIQIILPKPEKDEKYMMESQYKLFLMFLPFAALAFVFCYLPLYGWRYAFFDYTSGGSISANNFVGFKWFTQLFKHPATGAAVIRVLRNTLAMRFPAIATSWCAMASAILLSDFQSPILRCIVQYFTTIPDFTR